MRDLSHARPRAPPPAPRARQVFTGVTAWIIAMFYAVVSCSEGLQRTFWGVVEVAVNAVWTVFWLAAAASYSSFKQCKPSQIDILEPFTECGGWLASEAFAWMRCARVRGGGACRRVAHACRLPPAGAAARADARMPPPAPRLAPRSWLLWIPSLVISIVDMRRGEGVTGGAGKRYPVGTPA